MISWQSRFTDQPIFAPLRKFTDGLRQYTAWPTVADYNDLLETFVGEIRTCSNKPLKFVEQATHKSVVFHEQYEPRIYLKGEVQSRQSHWHDFFNMLIWLSFPRTKALLNALQYQDMLARQVQGMAARTRLQNFLAHFDECGMVVLYTSPQLMTLVKSHQWKDLFWQQRSRVQKNMQFIIFGHGLYEKALLPYIGLTGKAILFQVSHDMINMDCAELHEYIDQHLVNYLTAIVDQVDQNKLQPIPLLGIPDWDEKNVDEVYYHDYNYFRPKSR